MSRTDRLARVVARIEEQELADELEEMRRKAAANGVTPPPLHAGRATAVPPSDRPARVRAACQMYCAPASLADEINKLGLSVRQAHALLSKATGSARAITPAGVESVRVGLVALERARQTEVAAGDADRQHRVARLLVRFGLVHTRAGVAIAASNHPVDLIEQLVTGRANAFGRLDPAAQAHLLNDLNLTKGTTTS